MAAASDTTLQRALADTINLQRDAADPTASVWVSANAGTGKTHVLTNRVLRLLLFGTKPERILCVTYTKAAAAEMSKRIFDRLAGWVMRPQDDLQAELRELTGQPITDADCDHARTLFTSAIETPGGLKVQTIHGFCERLLQRFPLEAGIAAGFQILDEKKSKSLIRDAIDRVLIIATAKPNSPLGQALATAIAYASDGYFDDILQEALTHRQWLADMHRLDVGDYSGSQTDAARDLLANHFGLDGNETLNMVTSQLATVLTDSQLKAARDALNSGSKSDVTAAGRFDQVLAAKTETARADAITNVFLTAKFTPRASMMTKGLSADHSDVLMMLQSTQGRVHGLHQKRIAHSILDATLALYAIADAVMQAYTTAKDRQSALDFPDLIAKAVNLLNNKSGAEWVLYKLDEGLSHILVDESQDTSPEQWQLVSALSQEFFSGLGATDETRTVFAVGDEKQSIYSFQGAAPREFAKQGKIFSTLANQSGQQWHNIPLNLSFRTTEPVLNAVDLVFSDRGRTPGLSSSDANIEHFAMRLGHAGHVELWPTEQAEASEQTSPWHPLTENAHSDPVANLAIRIAETLAHWFETGEFLASAGRPVKPGDIAILVRKRHPFAPAMVAALKSHNIPVAGADRINLLEQTAIKDVLSLADFLTLPEDDLALAEVLKSPIFGFDDDDLLALAPTRGLKTLWKALLDNGLQNPRFTTAAETLKRWRKLADFAPPYEFFGRLFDTDKVRDKLISRLGPDTGEALDEFIDQALIFDEQEPPSLSGFLNWLRTDSHEVKRDLEMDRNEVRVMTVHGAKGLEAPIVFLPDTCSAPTSGKTKTVIAAPDVTRPNDVAAPFLWVIKDASNLDALRKIKDAHNVLEYEESHRLLYVAMTRARDRLYITGFERPTVPLASDSWYALVESALEPHLQDGHDHQGRPVKCISTPQTAEEKPYGDLAAATRIIPAQPDWINKPAPQEPQISIPLAPSKLAPYEIDAEGEPLAKQPAIDQATPPAAHGPTTSSDADRFLRGNLTHALLQHLPNFPADQRPEIAKTFVDVRGQVLSKGARASIISETLDILERPEFAPLFGPNSRPEVPIVARLKRPSGSGPDLRLNGAIDRLADLGDSIFVIDFKTNRRPPATLDEVADAYLYQLASYRLALGQIYPNKPVRAALLWTDGPTIMEIPSTKLDRYQESLWSLHG